MCTGVKPGAQNQIIPECVSGTGMGWLGDPGRKGDCLENENVPQNLAQSSSAFLPRYSYIPASLWLTI